MDRGAPHRGLGASPGARSADRAGADGDKAHPARAGRLPIALSPPGRAREPGRDARSHGPGAAEFRGRRQRPAERLGDVQCRRHGRPAPRDDPRGSRHHPQTVERRGAVRLPGQVLARHLHRFDAGNLTAPAMSRAIGSRSRKGRGAAAGTRAAPTGVSYARSLSPTPTRRLGASPWARRWAG